MLTFGVQARPDLLTKVIPFFERHPLLVKGDDFELFATIVRSLEAKEHLERRGFERIVELAYRMNRHGKQRRREMTSIVGSSETVRQAPVNSREMRQSDPHGDMWSQAEMT